MMTLTQIERREFALANNLIELTEKTLTEKEMLSTLERVGIKTFMCVDMDCKEEFFELSGLLIRGKHNNDVNRMEFKINEI